MLLKRFSKVFFLSIMFVLLGMTVYGQESLESIKARCLNSYIVTDVNGVPYNVYLVCDNRQDIPSDSYNICAENFSAISKNSVVREIMMEKMEGITGGIIKGNTTNYTKGDFKIYYNKQGSNDYATFIPPLSIYKANFYVDTIEATATSPMFMLFYNEVFYNGTSSRIPHCELTVYSIQNGVFTEIPFIREYDSNGGYNVFNSVGVESFDKGENDDLFYLSTVVSYEYGSEGATYCRENFTYENGTFKLAGWSSGQYFIA